MLDDFRLAADHRAVTALQSPDTAAGSNIDIVDLPLSKFLGAPNVIDVIKSCRRQ